MITHLGNHSSMYKELKITLVARLFTLKEALVRKTLKLLIAMRVLGMQLNDFSV